MKSTNKKGLLMSILWALVLITTVVSSVVVAQSAKAAKLYLRHNITYTAPTCIQVTFDANGGTFDPEDTINGVYETTSVREDTYNTTIKISTLSDGSIIPADEPTRDGYTFEGWEYSVNGTNYSDYASASDMPFTDHLYVRAKWEEVSSTFVTFYGNPEYTGGSAGQALYYQIRSTASGAPTMSSSYSNVNLNSDWRPVIANTPIEVKSGENLYIATGGYHMAVIVCYGTQYDYSKRIYSCRTAGYDYYVADNKYIMVPLDGVLDFYVYAETNHEPMPK